MTHFTHVLVAKYPHGGDAASAMEALASSTSGLMEIATDVLLLRAGTGSLESVPQLVRERNGVFLLAAIAAGETGDATWRSSLPPERAETGSDLYLILHDTLSVGPHASHRLNAAAIAHRILLPGVYLATISGSVDAVFETVAASFGQIHGRWAVLQLMDTITSRPAWLAPSGN